MILRLPDSLFRALLVLTAVLVSVWLSFFSVRGAMARYGAEGTTKRRLQLAARLEMLETVLKQRKDRDEKKR